MSTSRTEDIDGMVMEIEELVEGEYLDDNGDPIIQEMIDEEECYEEIDPNIKVEDEEEYFEEILEEDVDDNIIEEDAEEDEDDEEQVYFCNSCNTTFADFDAHVKEFHPTQSILVEEGEEDDFIKKEATSDDYSDGYFLSESTYQLERKEIKCLLCDLVLATAKELRDHMKKEHNMIKTEYICQTCDVTFALRKELMQHQKETGHTNKPTIQEQCLNRKFLCVECDLYYPTYKEFTAHKKEIHPQENDKWDSSEKDPAFCTVCNTLFPSARNLTLHMRIHNEVKSKTLNQVLEESTGKPAPEGRVFYCEICEKNFDEHLLHTHNAMHQNSGKSAQFNCFICNRNYDSEVNFKIHMRVHEEQQSTFKPGRAKAPHNMNIPMPYPCGYCDKKFSKPHEKVKHERVHTGEKPYKCEVCGKCFRVSYSLTLHLRTHTDIRPYVCAICNKRFKSNTVYGNHMLLHSDERPYKCQHCTKAFKTPVQLNGHTRSHTKPFNCPECNRKFASLYAVKQHMRTHKKAAANPNATHTCRKCGATYGRIYALHVHLKEVHQVDPKVVKNELNSPEVSEDGEEDDEGFLNEDESAAQSILQEEEVVDSQIVTDWIMK